MGDRLWALDNAGIESETLMLLKGKVNNVNPALSPNGNFKIYVSVSGRGSRKVATAPAGTEKVSAELETKVRHDFSDYSGSFIFSVFGY